MEATRVFEAQNVLGEGPVWNEEERALYWVDIAGKTINRFWPESREAEAFPLDVQVGVLAFRESGGMIVAGRTGFSFWSPKEKELKPICDPESDNEASRFNDGKVDRKGRFWAGTMTNEGAVSSLYRMDADLSVHRMVTNVTISNGIGWSPDNRTMYYVDSLRYVIYAYDFNLASGQIMDRRDLLRVDAAYGIPDGLTVDREGNIWCAFYGGAKVSRITRQGEIDREVVLPVTQPTSCAFGGEDYGDLYVTSAWQGLTGGERNKQPWAGDLFVIRTDSQGLPEPRFAG
jgi:sugar lactone lactonase YvrE